jgi:tetratricopeptide (TPR) repeat protein
VIGDPPVDQGDDGLRASPGHKNAIAGDVFGPAVLARDLYGDLHVHQGHLAMPTPSQLPPPVTLSGRSRDLDAIDSACASRTVVISGPPGIGKTALAVCWGHARRGGYPDGQLFADLRGYAADGPASPGEVLGGFLRALGVVSQNVPADLAERTALFRSVTSDRRIVVVLDDAISAAQVRPLLPASAGSVALVTSRWRLAGLVAGGARAVQLDRLESAAALDLLSRATGSERVGAEPAAASELAGLCGYFPLALCVCAARLVVRPRLRISELADALRHERQRLCALAVEDEMVMRAALDLSYRALPGEAARLYRLMGLFPGQSFGSRAAAATAGVPADTARRILAMLVDANLLDETAGSRYRFHDLVRLHALAMAEELEPVAARDSAVRRMLDWYLAAATDAGQVITPYRHDQPHDITPPSADPVRSTAHADDVDWLEAELPGLTAIIRFAADRGYPVVAWQTVDALWPLFLRRGHYRERLELDRIGLAAARDCGDTTAEAKMLGRFSLALTRQGRLDEAAEHLARALAIWREAGNEHRIAGSLRRLGLVEQARGRQEEALAILAEALAAYQRLGGPRAIALTLTDVGAVLTEAGRPGEAISHLLRARELLAGISDPYNHARTLARLGRAQGGTGDLAAATATLEQALQAMRQLRSLPGEADVLQLLGDVAAAAGQRAAARRRYVAALAIFDEIRSPDAARLRDRLARLGLQR